MTLGNVCTCGNILASGATPANYGTCNIPCTGAAGEVCGGTSCMIIYRIEGGQSPTTTTTSSTGSGAGESTTLSLDSTASTSLASSYPTSTGTPNCYDRSPFSGTVNDGYLILCDTPLPGYDLTQANGTDLADCIAACNAYVPQESPSQQEPCVAVEYDIVILSQLTAYDSRS